MKIICILDYCKTKAMCDSYNGAIINICRCDKLLILGYRHAQEEDSKVGGNDLSFVKGSSEAILIK